MCRKDSTIGAPRSAILLAEREAHDVREDPETVLRADRRALVVALVHPPPAAEVRVAIHDRQPPFDRRALDRGRAGDVVPRLVDPVVARKRPELAPELPRKRPHRPLE